MALSLGVCLAPPESGTWGTREISLSQTMATVGGKQMPAPPNPPSQSREMVSWRHNKNNPCLSAQFLAVFVEDYVHVIISLVVGGTTPGANHGLWGPSHHWSCPGIEPRDLHMQDMCSTTVWATCPLFLVSFFFLWSDSMKAISHRGVSMDLMVGKISTRN